MPTWTLRAGVQYNDWTGTAAADNGDKQNIHRWLEDNKLIQENEFLLAFEFWAGENHDGKHKGPLRCHAVFASTAGHDDVKQMIAASNGPVPLRRINFDMDTVEFFGLFKRFSVAMSSHGLLDPDREYSYPSD
jgi:hypothetical protein